MHVSRLDPKTVLISPDAPPDPARLQPAAVHYGLQCPKCDRLTPYEQIDSGCGWCGTSLASAISVVLPGESNCGENRDAGK